MKLKLKVTLQTFLYTAWSWNNGPSHYPLKDPLLGCAGLCPTSLHLEKAFNHFSKEVLWEVLLGYQVHCCRLLSPRTPFVVGGCWNPPGSPVVIIFVIFMDKRHEDVKV